MGRAGRSHLAAKKTDFVFATLEDELKRPLLGNAIEALECCALSGVRSPMQRMRSPKLDKRTIFHKKSKY